MQIHQAISIDKFIKNVWLCLSLFLYIVPSASWADSAAIVSEQSYGGGDYVKIGVDFNCDQQNVDVSSLSYGEYFTCTLWVEHNGRATTNTQEISREGCPVGQKKNEDVILYPGCTSSTRLTVYPAYQVWDETTRLCVGIMEGNGRSSHPDGILNTVPNCQDIPPPPGVLSCHTSDFTIDYGNIAPAAFDGGPEGEKTVNGSVTCTGGDATVKVYFQPPDIHFANGGQAMLTFSNNADSQSVEVGENETISIPVTSHLSSDSAVTVGLFSGITAMIAEIQ